jgi:ribosomal protein S18 acetylase RimI-like enzyme
MVGEYPKKVFLKDGTVVTLRPVKHGDKTKLADFFNRILEKERVYLRDDVVGEKTVEGWVDRIDYDRVFPLVAIFGKSKVVGDASLHRKQHDWQRHLAHLRLLVAPDFRENGLGVVLVRELLWIAKEKGLEKICIEMRADQGSTIRFFSKLGFKKMAVLKGLIIDPYGEKKPMLLMCGDIDDLTDKAERYLEREFPTYPLVS